MSFDYDGMMYSLMELFVSDLTDKQLAQISACVAIGRDPRTLPFWDSISHMFTAENENGIPEMHGYTKDAFVSIVSDRL